MYIEDIIWLPEIADKLLAKHGVTQGEAEELLFGRPTFRFVERGDFRGEDVYAALGQSAAGRYLVVYFILKMQNVALVLSARDMERRERRLYEQK